jgi:hypothetical protein
MNTIVVGLLAQLVVPVFLFVVILCAPTSDTPLARDGECMRHGFECQQYVMIL